MQILGSASTLLQKGLLDLKAKQLQINKHSPFTGIVTHACHPRRQRLKEFVHNELGASLGQKMRSISAHFLKVITLEHTAYIVSLLTANIGVVYLLELISIDLFLLTKIPLDFFSFN